MRLAHRAATTLLALALAAALTAAATPPAPAELDISRKSGISGTDVTLKPELAGPTCLLTFDDTPSTFSDPPVKRKFPCGMNEDEVSYRRYTYSFEGRPGKYDVIVTSGMESQSTTYEILAVVPDLIGLTQAQAVERLTQASLTLGGVITASGSKPDWLVFRQTRSAGSPLSAGRPVSIALKPPPPPPPTTPTTATPTTTTPTTTTPTTTPTTTVPTTTAPTISVPDVRQHRVGDARQILTDFGLAAEADPASGVVVDQDPAPGAQVAPASRVRLTVGAVPLLPDPPYLAIVAVLGLLVLVLVGVARTIRGGRNPRPAHGSPPPPPVDVRLVPPTRVTTDATATSPKPALDVTVRLSRTATITAESRNR